MEKEELLIVFKYFTVIFLILSFPSIVYFLLKNVGISIPHSVLYPANAGKEGYFYYHYPLGLVIQEPYFFQLTKPTGMFDESGVIGTLAGLLLSPYISNREIKKPIPILLIIVGMFSVSLAFYLLLMVSVILTAFKEGAFRVGIIITLFVVLYFVFINAKFDNNFLNTIQSRIEISGGALSGDNRTSVYYDIAYSRFVQEGGLDLWMGKGIGAISRDGLSGFSYKNLIYNFGIVGFSILLMIFTLSWGFNLNSIVVFIVFIISIYQRPDVFNEMYITVFFSTMQYALAAPPRNNKSILTNSNMEINST